MIVWNISMGALINACEQLNRLLKKGTIVIHYNLGRSASCTARAVAVHDGDSEDVTEALFQLARYGAYSLVANKGGVWRCVTPRMGHSPDKQFKTAIMRALNSSELMTGLQAKLINPADLQDAIDCRWVELPK